MIRKCLIAGAGLLFCAVGAIAGNDAMWLHLFVNEGGDGGERVSVNLPLKLVETVLPLMDEEEMADGKIRVEGEELSAAELREIWAAVRESDEGVYARVEGSEEDLSVAREGGWVSILVDEGADGETVNIRMPMNVIDALLSGTDNELDLLAAIRAFGENGGGDLLLVDDDESTVRVWVDSKTGSKRACDL